MIQHEIAGKVISKVTPSVPFLSHQDRRRKSTRAKHLASLGLVTAAGVVTNFVPGVPFQAGVAGAIAPKKRKAKAATKTLVYGNWGSLPGAAVGTHLIARSQGGYRQSYKRLKQFVGSKHRLDPKKGWLSRLGYSIQKRTGLPLGHTRKAIATFGKLKKPFAGAFLSSAVLGAVGGTYGYHKAVTSPKKLRKS